MSASAEPARAEPAHDARPPEAASASTLLWRLIRRARGYGFVITALFLLGLIVAGVRYARAWMIQPGFDELVTPALGGQSIAFEWGSLAANLALAYGLSVLIQPFAVFFRSYSAHWVVASVRRDLDQDIARRLLAAPLRAHRSGTSGDFLARALTDAQLACQAVLLVFNEVILNSQIVLMGFAALVLTSWRLTLLTLLGLPILLGVLSYFGKRVETQSQRRQETQGDLSQRLLAILSGIKVIKAFQGQAVEESAYTVQTGKYFRRHMKVVWNGVVARAVGEFVNPLIALLVMGVGLWLVMSDRLTLGVLGQFAACLGILYKPLKTLIQHYPKIIEASAGARRVFQVLDLEDEPTDREGARPMEGLRHSIVFRDVHFDYGGEPILQGIDLEIAPGEVVAFVGRTGTGKSTLMDLTLRFHDPTRGAIEIDGTDLRDYARRSFLDHVAVVTQEPFLFDVSVAENIRYGRRDATDDEIRAAARAASADAFVQALPEGYETTVGEFGLRLSGGQRQRLTIARAILADPAILVFDEATSALDAQTEAAVQEAIESLRGERTIFLVAHRLSTIRRADHIVVLDGGRIVQSGTHDELKAVPGVYRELIGVQAA
ncbi:MAG: ABC transporter ATP-binding protein [Myxococcota bacterium]